MTWEERMAARATERSAARFAEQRARYEAEHADDLARVAALEEAAIEERSHDPEIINSEGVVCACTGSPFPGGRICNCALSGLARERARDRAEAARPVDGITVNRPEVPADGQWHRVDQLTVTGPDGEVVSVEVHVDREPAPRRPLGPPPSFGDDHECRWEFIDTTWTCTVEGCGATATPFA